MWTIPEGEEVELLSFEHFERSFVRVRLKDGSIGFMPAPAFAETTVTLGKNQINTTTGKKIPDGEYTVVPSAAYVYRGIKDVNGAIRRWVAEPKKLLLKGTGGKTYDISGVKEYREGRWTYSPVNRIFHYGSFDNVFEQLPDDWRKKENLNLLYNPQKKNLNAYAGCTREYLESIFGQPYAYAGPAISDVSGLTYALYENILWRVEKKRMNRGVIVFYNQDQKVVRIENRPFDWEYMDYKDAAPLIVPLIQTDSKPALLDRIRIWFTYFYERKLGLRNPLAVAGVMQLFQLILVLLLTFWMRYVFNYGSNGWAQARCYLLPLPILLFNLVYLWRYPFLYFLVAGFICIFIEMIPDMILHQAISYRRCPKCHQYVDPDVLESEEGMFHGGKSEPYGRQERIRVADSGGYDRVEVWRHESRMTVTQEMKYLVRCPLCAHEWEQRKEEDRPSVRGPIIIKIHTWYTVYTPITTTTTTTTKDKFGGVIDTKEEKETTVHSKQEKSVQTLYDNERYLPYFRKYVNGDRQALDRYYKECWDSANELSLS